MEGNWPFFFFFLVAIYHTYYHLSQNKYFENTTLISYVCVYNYKFTEFAYLFCMNFQIEGWILLFQKIWLKKTKGEENMIGQKLYCSVFRNLIKSNFSKYEMTSHLLLIFL